MSKHTPGPWTADIRIGCLAVYAGEHRNCLSDVEESAIHYQSGRGIRKPDSFRYLSEEQIANAKLIAAAPELLASCKDLLALCKRAANYAFENGVVDASGQTDEGSLNALQVMEDARLAIEKAESAE